MKTVKILALALLCLGSINAQNNKVDFNKTTNLKLEVDYSSNNEVISDILRFEGIDYQKLKFTDADLKGKSYKLSVKEIWNGKITSDSIIIDSKDLGYKPLETINDSVFQFRIVSKHLENNKLKMEFIFPRFSITREFDAIDSDEYSLRNLPDESGLEVKYNEKFYLLAYILPYEREDGSKSWCEVGTAGKDIDKWGEKFGIEHYLLFEMKFE